MKLRDLTGQRFGAWLVLERTFDFAAKVDGALWRCRCLSCGDVHTVAGRDLRAGRTSSCRACYLRSAAEREAAAVPRDCRSCGFRYPWKGTPLEVAEVIQNLDGLCPQCARRSGLLDEEVETPGQRRKRARRRLAAG